MILNLKYMSGEKNAEFLINEGAYNFIDNTSLDDLHSMI